MVELKNAYNKLNILFENINIEIVKKNLHPEDYQSDARQKNIINSIQDDERNIIREWYEIEIDGLQYEDFLVKLIKIVDSFEAEYTKISMLNVSEEEVKYLESISSRIREWNDNIVEREVKIGDETFWIFIKKEIDLDFSSVDYLDNKLLNKISEIFSLILRRTQLIIENDLIYDLGEEEPEKIRALDCYQTALLFHYLIKANVIRNLKRKPLANLISPLTGHSYQNLRTKKGFMVIPYIIVGKAMNKRYSANPNHNLDKVNDILNIIQNNIRKDRSTNMDIKQK